ncbi:MAG: hypothetical protein ACI8P0_000863 [Planctomycetaceae bacterium]
MAFQSHSVFHDLLHKLASSGTLTDSAPAENFLLDERVSDARETDYFNCSSFVPTPESTAADWAEKHKSYSNKRLRLVPRCATFDADNGPAHLAVHHEMDVVRLETVSSLCERGPARLAEPSELLQSIRDLKASQSRHEPPPDDVVDFLETWLDGLNRASDGRPMFVAPFAAVEPLLLEPDWPDRLRDAMGLGHIIPFGGVPTPVVLFRYSLERSYDAHSDSPAWAATPTVLDDPATSGFSTCFFPAPRNPAAPESGCPRIRLPPNPAAPESGCPRIRLPPNSDSP